MKIRQNTFIAAAALDVWPFVADPLLQAEWNPNVVSIDRVGSGPVRAGETFRMIYRMSGRDKPSRVEIAEAAPAERVVFLHHFGMESFGQTVAVAFGITPHGEGVKVVQTVDLHPTGLPFPIRILLWFIHRVGRDTEMPHLERLRRIVEERLEKG